MTECRLKVHILEAMGTLRASLLEGGERETPVAGAYVKVYHKTKTNTVAFYKDGVECAPFALAIKSTSSGKTDINGNFPFATRNFDALSQSVEFAILVIKDGEGAVIKRCWAPQCQVICPSRTLPLYPPIQISTASNPRVPSRQEGMVIKSSFQHHSSH